VEDRKSSEDAKHVLTIVNWRKWICLLPSCDVTISQHRMQSQLHWQ